MLTYDLHRHTGVGWGGWSICLHISTHIHKHTPHTRILREKAGTALPTGDGATGLNHSSLDPVISLQPEPLPAGASLVSVSVTDFQAKEAPAVDWLLLW